MKEEVLKELRKRAVDGRVTCALARGVAEDLGVGYGEVGRAADELGIRIGDCELGCF